VSAPTCASCATAQSVVKVTFTAEAGLVKEYACEAPGCELSVAKVGRNKLAAERWQAQQNARLSTPPPPQDEPPGYQLWSSAQQPPPGQGPGQQYQQPPGPTNHPGPSPAAQAWSSDATKGLIVLVVIVLFIIGAIINAFEGDDDASGGDGGSSGGDRNVNFTMPSVVGMDLQDAQDLMQDNGVLYSTSHDLLGTRMQVLDSGWQVCTQTPAAGTQVTGNVEGRIDFGVVKRGESCP
jgi:PASTA domain